MVLVGCRALSKQQPAASNIDHSRAVTKEKEFREGRIRRGSFG